MKPTPREGRNVLEVSADHLDPALDFAPLEGTFPPLMAAITVYQNSAYPLQVGVSNCDQKVPWTWYQI